MHLGEVALRITVPMYEKGRSFILAGGLVKAYEGHQFVYLHLLCQGFENIGKAILLAADYEKYGSLLKPEFGHNLEKLLEELKVLYGRDFLTERACTEIQGINKFYKQHQLRYGDNIDFSGICSNLQVNHLHSELVAHLESLNQKFEEIENHA
jgi:hypothetical protein